MIFGKVAEGEKVSCTFTFDNKGTEILLSLQQLQHADAQFQNMIKKPIPPGASGNLDVVFDTSEETECKQKTITVKSNASKNCRINKNNRRSNH